MFIHLMDHLSAKMEFEVRETTRDHYIHVSSVSEATDRFAPWVTASNGLSLLNRDHVH